jgi:hypothetical protein
MFTMGKHPISRFFFVLALCVVTGNSKLLASDVDPRLVREFNNPQSFIIKALHEIHVVQYKNYPELILTFEALRDSYIKYPQQVRVVEWAGIDKSKHVYKLESPLGPDKSPTKVTYYYRSGGHNLATYLEDFFPPRTYAENAFQRIEKMLVKISAQEQKTVTAQTVELTTLQLRVLQMRKFNKSPSLVKEALSNMFKDEGGDCQFRGPTILPIGQPRPYDRTDPSKRVIDGYKVLKGDGSCQSAKRAGFKYDFEVDTPAPKQRPNEPFWYDPEVQAERPQSLIYPLNETTLRIRITRQANPEYDAGRYQEIFKSVADQLFIDAVEIDPISAE